MLRKLIPSNVLLFPEPADGGAGTSAPNPQDGSHSDTNVEKEQEVEEAQDEPPLPQSGKDDPLMQALGYSDKPEEGAPPEPPQVEKQDASEPAKSTSAEPEKAGGEPPKAEVEPSKPKKRVRVLNEDHGLDAPPPLEIIEPPAPVPVPAQPSIAGQTEEQKYIDSLSPEQKEELEEAEVAERLFPEKHKGRKQKLVEFYKRFDTEVQNLVAEDPERKLDESDPEFMKLMAQKPKISVTETRAVIRQVAEDSAVNRVLPEIERVKFKQREMEVRPSVESVVGQFRNGLVELIAADDKSLVADVVQTYKANGSKAAHEEFPLEAEIISDEVARASALADEYIMFAKGVRQFDQNNKAHGELFRFINEQGDQFAASGSPMLTRDGKRFATRAKYVSMSPEQRAQHWTFSHHEILNMLGFDAKARIESRLKSELELAERRGFKRVKKDVSAKAETEKSRQGEDLEPITPPKASPTPSKGAQVPSTKSKEQGAGVSVAGTLYG